MKDLVKYISNIFNRKKTDALEVSSVSDEYSELDIENSGCMTFNWDSKTGDFQVITTVEDESEASAEVLGMLLAYISEGHMRSFLIQSHKLFTEESEDTEKTDEFYQHKLASWGGEVRKGGEGG